MSRSELSWLHLSDLHVGLEDHGTDRAKLIEYFFRDLEDVLRGAGPVDLVLFTGEERDQPGDVLGRPLVHDIQILRGDRGALQHRRGTADHDELDPGFAQSYEQRLEISPLRML